MAVAVLGLVGVTDAALAGHGTSRVVAATNGTQYLPVPAAAASGTTLTWVTTTTVTTATTTRPTVSPTTPPPPPPPAPTSPPTTAAPRVSPPVVLTASLGISPSQANFPNLPPPYWPMPIVAVTITNTGGITVRSVVVHPVGVYSVPSSTCSTLGPGQSCVARVQFCPTSPNHYLNTLMVTGEDAATGAPMHATIQLNGIAT
jgi:hypothetical protein